MSISRAVAQGMENASWIRRMFEEGRALKARLGAENVFDLSLGNPILEPPEAFQRALRELAADPPAGMHRYMPNAGFASTRAAMAARVSREEGMAVAPEDIVMTVGAAGALNVAFKALLDPGDEVIVLAPYFVEYLFYVENHQGRPVVVETTPEFDLDLDAIAAALTPRTKIIVLNTPNNPTGRIYGAARLAELADLLRRHEAGGGLPVTIVHDTPYARVTYGDASNPPLLADHPDTLIAHSFSKELGLAGERIGYLAISPRARAREALRAALTFCNRVLGFINAPAIMQLAVERAGDAQVEMGLYRRLRQRLCDGLAAAGYDFRPPDGSFYIFPRSPIPDDVAFTRALQAERVLVVPGRGFGRPGHFRIAFCVDERSVEGAIPRLAAARKRALAGDLPSPPAP